MPDQASSGSSDDELAELVIKCLEADDPAAELERRTAGRPELRTVAQKLMQQVEELERAEPFGAIKAGDPDPDDRTTWPTIPDVELESVIGRGGQGFVFRGRQPYLDRAVAVKVLAAEWRTPLFLERFRREARMLAGLQHPHIVTCHQAGLSEVGECFLVMEYIDGPTLREWTQQNGPVPLVAALRLTRDLAQALDHAHTLGLVHRDVKPENVLLQPKAAPAGDFAFVGKLADLGLARPQQRTGQYTMLTPVGAIIGTPVTMAPEQFDAPERVDHRADIYGLGCVLHWALAGRPPFHGSAVTKLLEQKAAMRGPDAKVTIAGTPPAVLRLIARMLAYDPADRPQSYAALIAELDALLPDAPAPAAQRRWLAVAAIGTLVLAVAIGAWAPWRSTASELVVAASPTVVEGATATISGALPTVGAAAPPAWRLEQTAGAKVRVQAKDTGHFEFAAPRGAAGSDLVFVLSAGADPGLRREVRMHIEPDPAAAPMAIGEQRGLFPVVGVTVMSQWICPEPKLWGPCESGRGACVSTPRGRAEASLVLPRGSFELRGRIEPRFRDEPDNPKVQIADVGFRLLFAAEDAVALRIEPAATANRFRAALCHEQLEPDGAWRTVRQLASHEGTWTDADPLQFTARWHAPLLTCSFGAVKDPQPRSVQVLPANDWQVLGSPGLLVVHADRGVAVFTDWELAGVER